MDSTLQVTLQTTDGPVRLVEQKEVLPDEGAFYEVMSTWDLRRMSRPTWNESERGKSPDAKVLGLPDVWRVYIRDLKFPNGKLKPDHVRLDFEHTHYLVKINAEMQLGRIFADRSAYFVWWNSLTQSEQRFYSQNLTSACTEYRSHTNGFGLDNMHNYLTGERPDADDPKFAMLVTGRFRMKAVLENGAPLKRNIPAAGLCAAFECIDASGNFWQYSPLREWWLFDFPMSTARDLRKEPWGGITIVRDDKHELYPQFGERLVFPFWLAHDSTAWFPVNQLRTLPLHEAVRGKRLTV